jgi:hypothetical protein
MRPYLHKGNLVFASIRVPRLFFAEQPGLARAGQRREVERTSNEPPPRATQMGSQMINQDAPV